MSAAVAMNECNREGSSSEPYSRPQGEVCADEKVLVVLDGSRPISKYALEWAFSNVLVRPGESIALVALHSPGSCGPVRRIWGFPMSLQMLGKDCASPRILRGVIDHSRATKEVDDEIYDGCLAMIQDFQSLCDQKKISIDVKVQEVDGREAVAREAKKIGATWVVFDRHLKKEAKVCMELVQCNIVIVKPSEPKILRLNLKRNSRISEPPALQSRPRSAATVQDVRRVAEASNESASAVSRNGHPREKPGTVLSSPEEVMTPFTPSGDSGTSSKSSSDSSPCKVAGGPWNDGSPAAELVGRGVILEMATAGKGASFRAFYPDVDDGVVVPGLAGSDSSPNNALPKLAQGTRLRASAAGQCKRQPTGGRGDVQCREGTPASRPGSRNGSRNGSRANSRRGSPVKTTSARGSPARSVNGSKREAMEGGSRIGRERSLGQSLRAILQENAEVDCVGLAGGSPSGYHGDEEPRDTSPEVRGRVRHGNGKADAVMRQKMAVMLSKHHLPGPPPLCSTCQHKAPCFGKPPQRYSYRELEVATGGFSRANFLAEGGYGSVHRGVLPGGQTIAVKQYKLASTQGDKEFCAEVEVLSCAQHRNVVMLMGFCIEGRRRLLVYEFICNGSLDGHLYGAGGCGERERPVLEWTSRYKIAVGAARGLRYLHEECRVGCIVHRDLRPNNILLTHDFEPMVGDFGLARWQPDGHCGVETRVIGTFGYLAPEYTQHGQVTDKADVYSFGVVLLELITGRKAIDITRPKGEQCLTEWARPLLEERGSLPIDPRLGNRYSGMEVNSMLHAVSCCIRKDPSVRPRMAQVLKMLEGEMIFDANSSPGSAGYFAGRLNSNDMNYYPVAGSGAGEKVQHPRFISPESDYHSTCSSPTRNGGNLPFGPMVSSCKTKQSVVKRDAIRKQPMVSSYVGQDGQKLSYEALRAAYMDKVSSHHVTASAYESYQLGKDF